MKGDLSVFTNPSIAVRIDISSDEWKRSVKEYQWQLGVSLEDLRGDDYSVTHRIGELARQNYSGILAPSARVKEASNLILFDP